MNLYIYAGEDTFRLEQSLKNRLKKYNIDNNHIVTIDASDKRTFQIEQVLMECDTFSLFDEDKKAVIVKNPFFLSSTSKEAEKVLKTDSPAIKKRKENEAKKKESRLQSLETYLKHPNPNTILIFACFGYQADSRKKDFKLLQQYGSEYIPFQKMDDSEFTQYVDTQLKTHGFQLTKQAKHELLQRVNMDTTLLHAALSKMDLYNQSNLELVDIQHLVSLNSDVNIFALTSSFGQGDITGCMQAYQDMLQANYDYTTMIALLSKRLRVLYNMHLLYEAGYSNDSIATRMHVKSGYVYYALKDSSTMQARDILTYLNQLASIEQGIKQGTLDPKNSFEDFLIKNGKRQYARYQRTI